MELFRFGVERPLTLGTTESDELFNKPRQEMSKLASANDKLMVFRFFSNASPFPFSHFRFWCHFDDDNYVNIPQLVKVLKEYPAYQDWYLGKPSISSPIEIFLNPVSKLDLVMKVIKS
jgi:hypothetical protein